MKRQLIYSFLLILIWSCSSTENKKNPKSETQLTKSNPSKLNIELTKTDFEYSSFLISKGQLGKIKIGMTISEAESKISGLRKKRGYPGFGYGDGNPYLYYKDSILVFGLIPKLNTDTILIIMAADKNLRTTNGLSPKSTVKEILATYPNITTVRRDLMNENEWEVISDTINNWNFVFTTESGSLIGRYSDSDVLEVPSKPKNIEIKSDWIAIK